MTDLFRPIAESGDLVAFSRRISPAKFAGLPSSQITEGLTLWPPVRAATCAALRESGSADDAEEGTV